MSIISTDLALLSYMLQVVTPVDELWVEKLVAGLESLWSLMVADGILGAYGCQEPGYLPAGL